MEPTPVQMRNSCLPMKMKLKVSQQQVLASVFLVYTLQSDNDPTQLNETILENVFHLVELILQVWGRRDPIEYYSGTLLDPSVPTPLSVQKWDYKITMDR